MEFDRHTFYIVSAYGMLAIAVLVELWSLRNRRRHAVRNAMAISSVSAPPQSPPQTPEGRLQNSTESP